MGAKYLCLSTLPHCNHAGCHNTHISSMQPPAQQNCSIAMHRDVTRLHARIQAREHVASFSVLPARLHQLASQGTCSLTGTSATGPALAGACYSAWSILRKIYTSGCQRSCRCVGSHTGATAPTHCGGHKCQASMQLTQAVRSACHKSVSLCYAT